jgi:TRAP-type mannitol/chloroaromatic compound transport system permease large subunit
MPPFARGSLLSAIENGRLSLLVWDETCWWATIEMLLYRIGVLYGSTVFSGVFMLLRGWRMDPLLIYGH